VYAVRWLALGAIFLAAAGCVPSETDVAPTGTSGFTDVATEAGLSHQAAVPRAMRHVLESTGSGVSVADYDNDGDDDVYLPQQPTVDDLVAGRFGRPNELYRNNGDGTFTEVGESAGVNLRAWSNAAYFADYDNDGDQDLFVANWGANHFYSNNGDGTFTDVTASSGLAGPADGWSTAAAFADLDQNGLLDLIVVNYCSVSPADPLPPFFRPVWRGLEVFPGPAGLPGQGDLLYRNLGQGRFEEITEMSGLSSRAPLYGLGLIALDLDRDQDVDLFMANDSVVNHLWRNDGTMPLQEIGGASGSATNEKAEEQATRGVDAADYDGDGFVDLFVTNFSLEWNTLYASEGGMRFREATFEAGLSNSWRFMGWGTKFFDYDHDGRLDLGIANGHVYPQVDERAAIGSSYRQPNQLLRNIGDGRFEPVADAAWGAEQSSRGLALIDYDIDGDLDILLTHVDAAPSLLRNDAANQGNWLSVRLEGVSSNRDGIGARIEIEIGEQTLTRIVNPYGSFQSQSTSAVHFGLGDAEYIDRLRVSWPSNRAYEYKDLQVNRFYTIRERSGIVGVTEPVEVSR
jgi:hypothetical protein